MNATVLVPIADGTEEIEAVTIIDVLRRAGAEVTVASCATDGRLQITASRGVQLVAEQTIKDCQENSYSMIAVPGGLAGAQNLQACGPLIAMLKAQKKAQRHIAAICAAPQLVLAHHGLLADRQATGHPAFQDQIPLLQPQRKVVVDGNVITSQAPGTALLFSLALVEALFGDEKRQQVAAPMVI
jgi:4-methyl-5(b-hydroxyethyl)-thiazole monophosphate biosynthesis